MAIDLFITKRRASASAGKNFRQKQGLVLIWGELKWLAALPERAICGGWIAGEEAGVRFCVLFTLPLLQAMAMAMSGGVTQGVASVAAGGLVAVAARPAARVSGYWSQSRALQSFQVMFGEERVPLGAL